MDKNKNIFVTEHNNHELIHEWSIENLDLDLYKPGEVIEGPMFPVSNLLEAAIWSIKLLFSKSEYDYKPTITISLVSHMSAEELARHRPKMTVNYQLFSDNVELIGCLRKCKELRFDSHTPELEIDKVDNVPERDFRNLVLKLDCGLSVTRSTHGRYDRFKNLQKHFSWKIDSCQYLVQMSNNRNGFHFEAFKFDFQEHLSLTDNQELFDTVDPTNLHRWVVQFYPHGRDQRFNDSISIFLKHVSGPPVQVAAEFQISGNGNQSTILMPQQLFPRGRRWGIGDAFPLFGFIEKFGTSLRLVTTLKMIYFRTKVIESDCQFDYSNRNALSFLTKLYDNFIRHKYCDISLLSEIDNCYVKLHKIVLYACSSKFETINKIEKDSNNNNTNNNSKYAHLGDLPIVLMNFDKTCLTKFVSFLYKHQIDRDSSIQELSDLLRLSIEYEVEVLEQECETAIIRSYMSCENVIELLKLDAKYLHGELKKEIIKYVKRNYIHITLLYGKQWKQILERKHSISNDLLAVVLDSSPLHH